MNGMLAQTHFVRQCLAELMEGLQEKETAANALLHRSARQKQLIAHLPSLTHLPLSAYDPFLQRWHQENYLLVRVKAQGPIWLSNNLQVTEWTRCEWMGGGLQSSLSTEVHQLHSNLAKYQHVIASLKELKEMEQIGRQQEEDTRDVPSRELKLKRYIDKLEKEMLECHADIKKLRNEQVVLLEKLRVMEEREKERREFAELENRFKEVNEVALSEPPKRRQKKILINF